MNDAIVGRFSLSPHLVLIGLPGSGKTTVGRHLATRLELPFVDFDEAIERQFGKSVSRIFTEDGEPAFRSAEAVLSRELASQPSHVLSPGGGWIANREAMAHLRPRSRIIYLRVSPAGALQRLGPDIARRPLFAAGDPAETMQMLYDVRRDLYEEAADLTIDTELLGRGALLTRVVELVSSTWELNSDV
jgi:shikimate kinase